MIGDVTVERMPAYADFVVQNGGLTMSLGRGAGSSGESYSASPALVTGRVFPFSPPPTSTSSRRSSSPTICVSVVKGMTLGGSVTYAWAYPTVPDAHVIAKTLLGTLEVGYPFIRREDTTLHGSAGMDIIDQNVWFDHLPLTRDRLRVAFLRLALDAIPGEIGPRFSTAEPPWHVTALLEPGQGLHAFGATPDCGPSGIDCLGSGDVPSSRLDGHSNATVIRFTGYVEVRPLPKFTIADLERARSMLGSRC